MCTSTPLTPPFACVLRYYVHRDTRNTRIRRDENTRNSRQIYSDAGWLSKYGLHWMHNPRKLLLTRAATPSCRCLVEMFSFLLDVTHYTWLLFRNHIGTSAILGETRYHPRKEYRESRQLCDFRERWELSVKMFG